MSRPVVLSKEVAKPLSAIEREKRKNEEPKKQSREEWRKKKELEEARKLGNAPAEVDEEGKDINPHIPQYISTVPWYVDPTQRPSLKHQRVQPETVKEFSKINDWYLRGASTKTVATKYRKGACENCGAMTHKKKDCLERPRKIGAKFTGNMIAPDEHIQPDLNMDFDGKRDRWNGYTAEQHEDVIEEYAKIEVAKQALKAQKLQEELLSGKMSEQLDDNDDNLSDDDKYADAADMPGQNFDSKRRITVRNLRIREDTAKYLRNLDPNSAYYDPKTRTMRENPYANQGKNEEELDFAGDNFVRVTGDTQKMASMQMFAWEAAEKGSGVHLQADPTRLEMLQRTYKVRKEDFKNDQRDSILDKYGGVEHLDAPPKELLHAQTEDYVEYSRHGTVIKGLEKAKAKSKYIEDVYLNNHTSVWGSYWKEGRWGFQCCHSTIKQSYCTGNTLKEDTNEMPEKKQNRMEALQEKHSAWTKALGLENIKTVDGAPQLEEITEIQNDEIEKETETKSLLQQHREKLEKGKEKKSKKRKKKKSKKRKKKKVESSSSSSSSEETSSSSDSDEPSEKRQRKKMIHEAEKDKERAIKKAIKIEKSRQKEVDELMRLDERKRPYNSMVEVQEPTQEELEAYHRTKKNMEDPMAKFI
ncbi:pre-mRNA-splicing factor SLU7-like [Styela clava]